MPTLWPVYIIADLISLNFLFQVDSSSSFEWQRQLRYYWDLDIDNCVAKMALSHYTYGYEYLGACPRLVITPLTVSVPPVYILYINTLIHSLLVL